jgi:hypothetical protein
LVGTSLCWSRSGEGLAEGLAWSAQACAGKMPRLVSRAELDDISALVGAPQRSEGDRRSADKKAQCEARMRKWPDTIEAQRKRKEDAYKDRLAAQEAERVRLDQEEDARRAAERKQKIEYASAQIYRHTDKIKRLASAELISECLDTRGKQLALAARVAEAEASWAARFVEQEVQLRAAGEAREQAEVAARKEQARQVALTQKEQLAEVRARQLAALREEEAEGAKLIAQAEEDKAAEVARLKAKEETARQNQLAVVRANLAVKELKAEQARRAAAEEDKIAQYAREKDALKERQQAQARKIEAAKQKRRNDLIATAEERLRELNRSNAARLDAQVAQARAAEDKRIKHLADKRAAFAKTIDESRAHQVKLRAEEKEQQLRRDTAHAQRWREYNRDAEQLERLEVEAEKRAARQHQQILLNQAADKADKELEAKREQIFHARTLADQEEEDKREFRKVAVQRIAAIAAEGKNAYPLVKCLQDVLHGR